MDRRALYPNYTPRRLQCPPRSETVRRLLGLCSSRRNRKKQLRPAKKKLNKIHRPTYLHITLWHQNSGPKCFPPFGPHRLMCISQNAKPFKHAALTYATSAPPAPLSKSSSTPPRQKTLPWRPADFSKMSSSTPTRVQYTIASASICACSSPPPPRHRPRISNTTTTRPGLAHLRSS